MTERKGEKVTVSWFWPEEQCITYKVTPNGGGLMSATSIAKQLLAVCKLMEAPEDGLRWKTTLRAIYTEADGSIIFQLAIAPRKSALVSPPEQNTPTVHRGAPKV